MLVPRVQCLLLCTLALLACSSATAKDPGQKLKILAIFGFPGTSHFNLYKPLLEELARRGHELTVISYFPRSEKAKTIEPLPNYKDINLLSEHIKVCKNEFDLHHFVRSTYFWMFQLAEKLHEMASVHCEAGLNHPLVKDFVAAGEKFDLVISETFNTRCFYALFHRMEAPFIEISPHDLMPWVNFQLGISSEAAYKPSMFSRVRRPLDFLQRSWNLLSQIYMNTVVRAMYNSRDQRIAEKAYGPGLPDLQEMSRNVSLMLVNTHFSLMGPHPYPPNVVEVGGLHIPKKPSPLPKDIKKFLDEAPEGVLYFNLGSVVKTATMPKEKLKIVMNVLASLPRKVIWKWEDDHLPKKIDNVLAKKWLPQYDIMSE